MSSPGLNGNARYITRILALAVTYFVVGWVGLRYAATENPVTLFWLPHGVAVAVLVRFGLQLWPGVLAGSVLVGLLSINWAAGLIVAVGNFVAPVFVAHALCRGGFDWRFPGQRHVLLFVGWAVLVGPSISACVGTFVRTVLRGGDDQVGSFLTWFLGDMVGVVVAAPALFAADWKAHQRLWSSGLRTSVLVSAVGLIATCLLVFGPFGWRPQYQYGLLFLPLVLVCRSALLFGRLAAVDVAILAFAAVVGLIGQTFHLSGLDAAGAMQVISAYLTSAGILCLLVTALTAERDTAERGRQTSESEYRALVEDNPAMICRFRPDGRLTFANLTYKLAFGSPHDTLGLFLSSADPIDREAILAGFRELSLISPPATAECPVRDPAGHLRWHRWTARAVDLASGEVAEYHAVGLDVTDQKRAEAETQAFTAKMVQTQKLESIGVLAGGIAHEFNNQLTGILGNAELVGMDLPDDRPMAAESLAAITAAAHRAAHLTRQLLVYAGKGPAPTGTVNLTELVRASADLVAVSVPKRCPVRYDLADGLPAVTADADDVRQVIINLVSNAGEAVAGTSGTVTVRTGRGVYNPADPAGWLADPHLPAGECVMLQVSDDGPGMSADVLARAFEPFFTTRFPGRGLGLPAVIGIVRSHGGALQMVSRPGAGTTVTVLFPPADRHLPAAETPGSSARWLVPPSVRAVIEKQLR